ncbi:MAG: class I SAM-dependent methyltransferase [Syntrophorhabdaceae bacterium]|nr:class I SAM-dependent methyltransferase [Syntrophorhabdaceae bacterium]
MHIGNQEFLNFLRNTYPNHFHRARVLELGSLNVNGTCRTAFTECEYVGIDIADGPDVDIVVAAKNTLFVPEQFDTLISMSMIEHDPTWRESLAHNMQWLRRGGLFAICYGGEGNCPHAPFPWAAVPKSEMDEFISTLQLENVESFYEGDRFYPDCGGAFDLFATKKIT